jgi:hypothetical protein
MSAVAVEVSGGLGGGGRNDGGLPSTAGRPVDFHISILFFPHPGLIASGCNHSEPDIRPRRR